MGGRVPTVAGEGQGSSQVNIFRGNDPTKWQRNIATYDQVNLGEVYEGVEVKLKAYGRTIEKLFHVNAEAAPEQIKIKLHGAQGLTVSESGELEVATELGAVRFSKPVAYQEQDGQRQPVEVAYTVKGDAYGFKVGTYDRSRELVIDPILAATFLGGGDTDEAHALALDSEGNVYVAGTTRSADFPGTDVGSADPTFAGFSETFVVKFNADLTDILAATFLGGNISDEATALALDSAGSVYVAGTTHSADFPGIGAGSADSSFEGTFEPFIAKLNADLSDILVATFIGGEDPTFGPPEFPVSLGEGARALVLDSAGTVYVAGFTSALAFPGVAADSADATMAGVHESFVARLDGNLSAILAATFLGGNSSDGAAALAPDSAGSVYVAGTTSSPDFPGITASSADNTFAFSSEAFVVRLDADLNAILAATFLGGNISDEATALALDSTSTVYVVGETSSATFPGVDADSADSTQTSGAREGFVARLDADLSTILAATFLGGNSGFNETDRAAALALDSTSTVYVAGFTDSPAFPGITAGAADSTIEANIIGRGEAFVARLDADLSTILAATLLGGDDPDSARALTLDSTGNVYVAGVTSSADFPGIHAGAADSTIEEFDEFGPSRYIEAFVVRLDADLSTGCGNERIDLGEECDDGNRTSLDGCSALCVIEFCGDGIAQRALGEECDDGNTIDGDGCSAFCLVEENLLEKLKDLVDSCDICPPEVIDALLVKINLASKHVRKGLNRPAVNALEQFQHKTDLFVRKGQLPQAEGERFITAAADIIAELSAPR